MKSVAIQFSLFFFMIMWSHTSSNDGKQTPCSFTDSSCLTTAVNNIYPDAVISTQGKKSSEPLMIKSVSIDMPKWKFVGNNVTLHGLLACVVKKLSMCPEQGSYEFVILCPKLKLEIPYYKTNGQLYEKHIVGCGSSQSLLSNNELSFTGYFSSYFDSNKDFHTRMETFKLKLKTEHVRSSFTGLTYYTDHSSFADWKAISTEDLKQLEDLVVQPVIEKLMPQFKDNLNQVLTLKPINRIMFSSN